MIGKVNQQPGNQKDFLRPKKEKNVLMQILIVLSQPG